MKVLIDCFKLVKGEGKSIGIYNFSVNLVKNLVMHQKDNTNTMIRDSQIIIIGNKFNRSDFEQTGVRFIEIRNYDPLNKFHCLIWELFAISLICRELDADRVIFPRGFCAITHPVKDIVIIHDMIPFFYREHYPDFFDKFENAYIMCRLKFSARKCSKVITISEASKKEIIKYCGISQNKIEVIYNGCNEVKACPKSCQEYEGKYICAVTSYLPHKNAKGIFEAYKRYCNTTDNPLNLVVIGVEKPVGVSLPGDVLKRITCYKFIRDDNEFHSIIASAKAFVFLSYVEGFGFPPIEAMQLGIPVICSNVSSLPEIVDDAAIKVNPDDYDEIARAIHNIISDGNLASELRERGIQNLKRFSWRENIRKYWDVLIK